MIAADDIKCGRGCTHEASCLGVRDLLVGLQKLHLMWMSPAATVATTPDT